MKALSIQQPWAWFIAQGYKDVENREWNTSYRGEVLIHAGKKIDTWFFNRDGNFVIPPNFAYFDCMKLAPRKQDAYELGGIIGIATLVDVVTSSHSAWFNGTYGFVFKNARPLPFMPLRGQLYFFNVPDEIAVQVR